MNEIIENFWICPMNNCNHQFEIKYNNDETITQESYNKASLHFLLHSNILLVGSHDFLAWWIDNIPENAIGADIKKYPTGDIIWKRKCYNSFHHYLDEKMNYLKIDHTIQKMELELFNRDLADKRNWRKFRKTENYFNECRDLIIGDLIIGTCKMFRGQKEWYYKKKQIERKPYSVKFIKEYYFLKENDRLPIIYKNIPMAELSLENRWDITLKCEELKRNIKNKTN